MWEVDNNVIVIILFYSLYYDIVSLTSLIITQEFNLLLRLSYIGFAENQIACLSVVGILKFEIVFG